MKGNVRQRGNGRLEGNRASVKEREKEGGAIGPVQMESIFAPFHHFCARVDIKVVCVL